LAWKINVPKFDNEPLHGTQHIFSFLEIVCKIGVVHEDILIKLFFISFDGRKRAWVRNGINLISLSSCQYFIRVFFKYWGPTIESFDDMFMAFIQGEDEIIENREIEKTCTLSIIGNQECKVM